MSAASVHGTYPQKSGWLRVDWLWQALLVLLAAVGMAAFSPLWSSQPQRDAAWLQYVGAQILSGKLLYRDVWEFHPPLGFFLNSLGVLLSPGSSWGIWILQALALAVTGLLFYRFLRGYFGHVTAWVSTAGMLVGVGAFLRDGNAAQFYALPLQAGIFLLLRDIERAPRPIWRYGVIGVLLGLCISLDFSEVGLGLAVLAYVFFLAYSRRDGRVLLYLAGLLLGGLLVWSVWIAYFALNHALPHMADALLRFPLAYYRIPNPQRMAALLANTNAIFHASVLAALGLLTWWVVIPYLLRMDARFRRLVSGKLFGAALACAALFLLWNGLYDDAHQRLFSLRTISAYRVMLIVLGAALLGFAWVVLRGRLRVWLSNKLGSGAEPSTPLLLPLFVAFLDVIIQLAIAFGMAQQRTENFLPAYLALAILVSFLLWSFLPRRAVAKVALAEDAALVTRISTFLLAGFLLVNAITISLVGMHPEDRTYQDFQVFLQKYSRPGVTIFQWGSTPQLYDFADPSAAVLPYHSTLPLFTRAYTTPQRVEDFFAELRATHPQYIVDTRDFTQPLLSPGDPTQCARLDSPEFRIQLQEKDRFRWDNPNADRPYIPPGMEQVYRWICENYQFSNQSSRGDWLAYRYHGEGQP